MSHFGEHVVFQQRKEQNFLRYALEPGWVNINQPLISINLSVISDVLVHCWANEPAANRDEAIFTTI